MQWVRLAVQDLLCETTRPLTYAYFPLSGLVTLVIRFQDGFQAEVGVIGREGVVGISSLSGVTRAGVDAVVQIEGEAVRVAVADLLDEAQRTPDVALRMRLYGANLWSQIMQIAACNGRHSLEQRLARWLLQVQDRVDGTTLALTQETLASMLGVHRPSVTVAAGRLQKAGAISYSWSKVTITGRERLEAASCECYAALRNRNIT